MIGSGIESRRSGSGARVGAGGIKVRLQDGPNLFQDGSKIHDASQMTPKNLLLIVFPPRNGHPKIFKHLMALS